MLIPATATLVASRNADLQWSPTIQRNGSPIDFTGYAARLQFRNAAGATGDPLLDLGTEIAPTAAGSSLTFPSLTTGVVALFVAKADWAAFIATPPLTGRATFYWDLLITEPGAVTERFVKGTLQLDPGVTR